MSEVRGNEGKVGFKALTRVRKVNRDYRVVLWTVGDVQIKEDDGQVEVLVLERGEEEEAA